MIRAVEGFGWQSRVWLVDCPRPRKPRLLPAGEIAFNVFRPRQKLDSKLKTPRARLFKFITLALKPLTPKLLNP